jgi:hypothetical protein
MADVLLRIERLIGGWRRGSLSDRECVSRILALCAEALGIKF